MYYWNEDTLNYFKELKTLTDRPTEVRMKPNRTQRISNNSLEDALYDEVHCLDTYNSIAVIYVISMNGIDTINQDTIPNPRLHKIFKSNVNTIITIVFRKAVL